MGKKKQKFKRISLKQNSVSFIHGNVINLDISYVIISYFLYTWSRHLNADFMLGNCLVGVD